MEDFCYGRSSSPSLSLVHFLGVKLKLANHEQLSLFLCLQIQVLGALNVLDNLSFGAPLLPVPLSGMIQCWILVI